MPSQFGEFGTDNVSGHPFQWHQHHNSWQCIIPRETVADRLKLKIAFELAGASGDKHTTMSKIGGAVGYFPHYFTYSNVCFMFSAVNSAESPSTSLAGVRKYS